MQRWMSLEVISSSILQMKEPVAEWFQVACVCHSTRSDLLLHNLELPYFNTGAQKALFQRMVPVGAELFPTKETRRS